MGNNSIPSPQQQSNLGLGFIKGEHKLLLGRRWLLACGLFLLVLLTVQLGLFERAEMGLYDAWFRIRGVVNPGDKVVIIGIDDASIQKEGRLPWPRSKFAGLLPLLKDAKVVSFDLIFDVPTQKDEDTALAEAIAKHGRVVLASRFTFEADGNGELEQVFTGPLPEFDAGVLGLGFINMPTNNDGVVRDFFPIDLNFEPSLPSFGLMTALAAIDADPLAIKTEGNKLLAAGRQLPLDADNKTLIEFWGPKATFKTYSFSEVIGGRIAPATFKDKIVLLGSTAVIAKDDFPTPYTTSTLIKSGNLPTPGVEIHASIVNSFLENRWYNKASPLVNVGFLLLVGLATPFLVSGRGPWQGLAGFLLAVLVTVGVALSLWYYQRVWLNVASPLVLVFLNYAVMTAADFIQAELGRRRVKAMFSRYVSPDVAAELMQNPSSVALGGRHQMLTVMFCDIRGFTAYSENKDPQEVVKRLNEYLAVMTKTIFHYGGTLDKYLGDGLMAIFGAPVFYPDHVGRSIEAALKMQEEIGKLNKQWAAKNEPPLKIGVGINSGRVLVGNVGSPERMDYTVIGEDVNLASRVEGLTKSFNTSIVISERSVKLLEGQQFPRQVHYLGQAEVKGFTAPIGVYTIVGQAWVMEEDKIEG